ncbi:MAG: NAD(P)-dependent oxidoreductase, partial [Hyphomicrobiales bacterium]|nr:NAD(P)-dependent oxidoreductase [Hyphomicrobiales bacterium]
ENANVVHAGRLLPIGLAEGCRLVRNVPRDACLTYDDVEVPARRLCDELRREQDILFFGAPSASRREEAPALSAGA